MRRGFTVVVFTLLVVASGCASVGPAEDAGPGGENESVNTVPVTTVVDGDTIKIRRPNGTLDTVRLLGVDTPETHAENDPAEFEGVPDTEAGRACLREAGQDATQFLTAELLAERVTVELDATAENRGYYGRRLGYVVHDGTNLNYQLVVNGYARVYDSEFTESDRFYAAEERARANGTGLWACATAVTDDATGLVVARLHADAAGDDREQVNDEYVGLENNWNRSRPVWNDDGDTVTVSAPNGTVITERSGG